MVKQCKPTVENKLDHTLWLCQFVILLSADRLIYVIRLMHYWHPED